MYYQQVYLYIIILVAVAAAAAVDVVVITGQFKIGLTAIQYSMYHICK